MRIVSINKLKIGDWVVTSDNIKKGKFQVARVIGLRLDKLQDFNIDKGKISKETTGWLDEECFICSPNKKELDSLFKLKIKLGIIEELREGYIESKDKKSI